MWDARKITAENKWQPFKTTQEKPDVVRALGAPGGVADRLRLVAFAELQARDTFLWGAKHFADSAPAAWTDAWIRFAEVENKHAQMLLTRMEELGVHAGERTVSDRLSQLCFAAKDPLLFLFLISSAEERGMEAGNLLGKQMRDVDATSAAIFQQIAEEEVEHVDMANAELAAHDKNVLKELAKAHHYTLFPKAEKSV